MSRKFLSFKSSTPSVYIAPWERAFDRVLAPIDEFIHRQSTSSLLLMLCALVALALANSPLYESYEHLLHVPLALALGDRIAGMSLRHWINDGLMALYFLVIGLELKRELLMGELANPRRALLPVLAATGGMVVPALCYLAFNPEGLAAAGWGIPMATDIAFAVGALTLLGNRVPRSLVIFLIALAIVDDLGAVLVIALFYTNSLDLAALLVAALMVLLLVALNLGGVQRLWPYLLVGVALWCATLQSGVHATIAGVALAFCIPLRPKYNPAHFAQEVDRLSAKLRAAVVDTEAFQSQIAALEKGMELVQAPAKRLENNLHFYVAYGVIPLFALANAGIHLSLDGEGSLSPVTLGVLVGLVMGKLIGIVGVTWLAVLCRFAALPDDLRLPHVIGIGLLAGIGFTMSIFIADLAFSADAAYLLAAKTGILIASLVSGIAGIGWLWFIDRRSP